MRNSEWRMRPEPCEVQGCPGLNVVRGGLKKRLQNGEYTVRSTESVGARSRECGWGSGPEKKDCELKSGKLSDDPLCFSVFHDSIT